MKHTRCIRRLIALLCACAAMLLSACHTDAVPQNTAAVQTETAAGTDTLQTSAAEDTEPVSSPIKYTLQYTTIDYSAQIPNSLQYKPGLYSSITYSNSYINNGIQYLYTRFTENGIPQSYLYPFSPDQEVSEPIPVPLINGKTAKLAYLLSDGRFILCVRDNFMYIYLTEADGTILAQYQISQVTNTDARFIVSEEEDGSVTILFDTNNRNICLYYYNPETNIISQERVYISADTAFGLQVDKTHYLGNRKYISVNHRQEKKILDMNRGTLQDYELRLPADQKHMNPTIGADGNIYLSDYEGIYLYTDSNSAPSKVLDWSECNSKSSENNCIWIADETTFYLLKTETTNGQTRYALRSVKTERVPQDDFRGVIELTCFGSVSEWLSDAIFTFNQENEDYRIEINVVNVIERDHEDINRDLEERMLGNSHPDLLIWLPTTYRPLSQYYEKGVFVDLMPYFGEDLLTCAAEALTYKGALYSLPTAMRLDTFVCADSVTDTYLTWEKFYEIVDSIALPDSLLSTEEKVAKYIYNNGIMDFCDFDTDTAYYDTDTFRDMILYTERIADLINEDAGRLAAASDGSLGYTRAWLPSYLAEGKIKLLNVPIRDLNDILAPRIVYGGDDFTWCGYPSSDGGGAQVALEQSTFSVFADSDVRDGCIEFLAFLLSVGQQSKPSLQYLPVTESGLRALFAQQRWWYYEKSNYDKFSDPNAELVESPFFQFSGVSYICTDAHGATAEYMENYGSTDNIEYEEEWMRPAAVDYVAVELTDADAEAFIDFLNSCHMKANVDATVREIIEEELSFWRGSVRTLEETSKIIQSRVWIYLNE